MKEHFVLHPEFEHLRSDIQDAIDRFSQGGEFVVDGERNAIKKFEIPGVTLNIKSFKKPNIFQAFVYRFLRKSKAERSYLYAARLQQLGINTPKPIGYVEHRGLGLGKSFYISEHLNYDFDFRTLNHNPTFPNRSEILKQFAKFTFQLHENSVQFLDHSPGNTLIVEEEWGQYSFYLIDLNRMRFKPLSFDERMRNFRRLWLSKTMINLMAPVYAELSGEPEELVHSVMTHHSRAFQKKINSKKIRRKRRQK